MSEAPELTLVIPAYNEAARLGRTLGAVRDYLASEFSDWEIVVVDDGSVDDTVRVASEILGDDPRVQIVRLPENRGKGAAVRAGVLRSGGSRVLFSDADFSTPIEDERLLRAALDAGADVVIASRALPDSRVERAQNVFRESLGKLFNWLIRRLGLTRFRDTQCGFKMFRGEVARELFSRARIDGFAFDVEVLLLAERAGLAIAEVPVQWRNDPSSRLGVVSAPTAIVAELIRIYWIHRRRR